MPPVVGMRFGRYELLDKLGAGGMGEVYRARDLDLGRDVAVKFLPEPFAAIPDRLGRFAQEARAASSLNHPNIVTIHEVGETAGLPFTVMELVDGATLRHLMRTEHPLPARKVLDVACQLAEGLARAHAAGIVHRDLKPENVMLTRDGFVKILDFGLAKLRGDGGAGDRRGRRAHLGDADLAGRPGVAPHRGGRRPGDGRVHVARAGARTARGPPLRPVRPRRHPLRDGERTQALPAGDPGPDPRRDHRGRAGAAGDPKRHVPGAGALDRRAVPGQGPGRALRLDARPRPRAARRAPAPLGGGQLGRRRGRATAPMSARGRLRLRPRHGLAGAARWPSA